MNLENYVLEKYLKKVIKVDNNGKQYILEKDIENLHLNAMEKKFVFQIMDKYHIDCRLDLIKEEDRPTKVSEFEYGRNIDSNVEKRDVPKMAIIEYDSYGNIIKEDYTRLDMFLEEEFLPDNVIMTKRKEKKDKEFDGYVDTKVGKRKKYKRELYPSVQLNKIIKLQLSDREYDHVLKYLQEQDILVRGKDSTIDQEFDNYDYYVTYKNEILPNSLTKEENYEKFVLYNKTKDPVLREQLILGNLRLVPYVAWGFAVAYDRDVSELESYGYEALIEAVERFDYTRGNSFSSYAVPYIRGFIKNGIKELDYIKRNEWADSFYRNRRIVEEERGEKLSENINLAYDVVELMMKEGEVKRQDNPSVTIAIATPKDPDKRREKIEENVQRIKFLYSKNLDDFVVDSELDMEDIDEVNNSELVSSYGVEDDVIALNMIKDVREAMDCLTPRERSVLEFRFGFKDGKIHSFDEVARIFGLSRERIRQIEAKSLRKLRHPSRSKKLRDYLEEDNYRVSADIQDLVGEDKKTKSDLSDTMIVEMDDKWKKDWEEITSRLKKK